MSYLDLKIGFSCNNNCLHCVIDVNRRNLEKNNLPIDSKFSDLMELIKQNLSTITQLVITGGEPFLRGKEIIRIVRYITENKPDCNISVQTNGRLLKNYIHELEQINNRIFYVIALHGTKETHDIITNNGKSEISPFDETIESIRELKKLRNGFKNARIEVVLSKYNLDNISELLEFCKQEEIKHIGISYPHLDGFYFSDKERFNRLTFSYKELSPILTKISEFCKRNTDYIIDLEEVPRCARYDTKGNYIEDLPNLGYMSNDGNVFVKYPSEEVQDFKTTFLNMHKKYTICEKCMYNSKCLGVWEEYFYTHKEDTIKPIL